MGNTRFMHFFLFTGTTGGVVKSRLGNPQEQAAKTRTGQGPAAATGQGPEASGPRANRASGEQGGT